MKLRIMRIGINIHYYKIGFLLALGSSSAFGEVEQSSAPPSTPSSLQNPPSVTKAQKIDTTPINKEHWTYLNDEKMNVIQNRIYTKEGKINIAAVYGIMNNDPFLNTQLYGGQITFYPSEYIGLGALYWRLSNSSSSAQDAFVTTVGYGTNSNPISSIYGGELTGSILYGKLSLVGKAIIHFDLYLLGGAGSVQAQNGTNFAPWIGIGQQFYLNHFLSLKLDYRLFRYVEDIVERHRPATENQVISQKTTYASAFNLGLSVLLF